MLLIVFSLYFMKGCAFTELSLVLGYSTVLMLKWYEEKGVYRCLVEIQLYSIKERPWGSFFHAKNLEKILFNNNNTTHKHNSTHILGKKSKLLKKKKPPQRIIL